MERKKIEYLVVDTGAFLKNAAIQELGENVVTCQEVVNEVTSKRQIRRLVVLPYELQIKEVFPENVQFVTDFAKKTGDYPSLSATDIKVIALTYQLEKEKVGTDHLHSAPEMQRTISFENRPTVELKDMAGFFVPSGKAKEEDDEEDGSAGAEVDGRDLSKEPEDELKEKLSEMTCNDSQHCVDDSEEEEEEDSDDNVCDEQTLDDVDPSAILVKVQDSGSVRDNSGESCGINSEEDKTSGDEAEEIDDDSGNSNNEDDDDSGWITPGNIKEMKKQLNAEFEEDKPVKVACITTDFAMQNVLKQIGLNISSVDGRVIKQLRTFILRCYACFKTTSVMTKAFCPGCGHKTLKRVAVSVEPDGTQKIHINLKKPLTTRGKKFSLPTFQGGKHANNPVLFADQPMPDQRPSRLARTKTNILDTDYIPGFSPFVMRDTTSKSAMLGIRGSKEVKHWMRKNPNEAKPHAGRKKK